MGETTKLTSIGNGKSTADLVVRTLELLLRFSIEHSEWGVTELAASCSMTKSRVHRILRTLEEQSFVRQNPTNRKYQLGIRVFELGAVAARGFGRGGLLGPCLEQLALYLGATVSIRVADGNETVLIDKAESPGPVRVITVLGSRYPLYFGAAGLALSSALPNCELDRLIPDGPLASYGPASYATGTAFRRALSEVRRRGYSVSDEGAQRGVRSVGVPVRNLAGNLVCSLVAGFAKANLRDKEIPAVGNELMRAAPEIARLLCQFNLMGLDVDMVASKVAGKKLSTSKGK
ncbi:MAG: IclR family transcriptional regulator [Gammaproteobacteria bacterium]